MCGSVIGESLFSPEDGSVRTLCIDSIVFCPYCGIYLGDRQFVGVATDNYKNGPGGLIAREFIVTDGDLCQCIQSVWAHDKNSAIPVGIVNRMAATNKVQWVQA